LTICSEVECSIHYATAAGHDKYLGEVKNIQQKIKSALKYFKIRAFFIERKIAKFELPALPKMSPNLHFKKKKLDHLFKT
jgi:hypothetical protein